MWRTPSSQTLGDSADNKNGLASLVDPVDLQLKAGSKSSLGLSKGESLNTRNVLLQRIWDPDLSRSQVLDDSNGEGEIATAELKAGERNAKYEDEIVRDATPFTRFLQLAGPWCHLHAHKVWMFVGKAIHAHHSNILEWVRTKTDHDYCKLPSSASQSATPTHTKLYYHEKYSSRTAGKATNSCRS